MDSQMTYPSEPLDHLRGSFEELAKRVAVESFGYTENDEFLNLESLPVRNADGNYVLEWVRGAWEIFKLTQ